MHASPESVFNFPDDDKSVSKPIGHIYTNGVPNPNLLAHANGDGTITVLDPNGNALAVPDHFKSLTVHIAHVTDAFNKLSDSFVHTESVTYGLKHVADEYWKHIVGQWNEPWHAEYSSGHGG